MATLVKFSREVRLVPWFKGTNPEEEAGTLRLEFIVRASLGAVVLTVRMKGLGSLPYGAAWAPRASPPEFYQEGVFQPWRVDSHFKRKVSDRWVEGPECDLLDQGYCFGDSEYLIAEDAWKEFQKDPEQGWKYLEDTYLEWREP